MSHPVSVLHLTVHQEGGGTERNVHLLCKHTPGFRGLALQHLVGLPTQWSRVPQAMRTLRESDAQVVFCYGARSHLFAAMACRREVALVGNIRSVRDFAGIKAIVPLLLGHRFRTWVSNSRKALGKRPGRVIYNGVAEPPDPEYPMLRDLPRPVMGILARGAPFKGHRWLMRLWDSMGKPGSLVFGGNLGTQLEAEAHAAGVHCPGYVEPGGFLRSLDLLAIPSEPDSEGVPTVVFEAMIRGIPVLATPAGGVPEVLRHGDNGFLLPREQWRAFLERGMTEEWQQVGERARREASQHYTFARMQQQFLEVVNEVRPQ